MGFGRFLALLLPLLLCVFASPLFATDFLPAEQIAGDGLTRYSLSRLANNVLAFDSEGRLHAVYWSGPEGAYTNPTSPAYVYYRIWLPESGWSGQISIDDSFNGDGHIGGRHPSLAITDSDTVWVVWHDGRDTTPGNWLDNLEIYADFRPKGGAFSSSDIRLSNGTGNGYVPRVAADASGRIHATWYDFHFTQGSDTELNVSDIFLKSSDAEGLFNPAETMTDIQFTDYTQRGGAVYTTPSYTMPDLAVDPSGDRHLIWVVGTGDSSPLYYARIPAGSATATEAQIEPQVRAYFDPPHIAAAPNGDIWIAYADAAATSRVMLKRLRAGQTAFDTPIPISSDNAVNQYNPDVEVDADGIAHIVWIRRRSTSDRDILYATYDIATDTVGEPLVLSPEAGKWDRPSLALSDTGVAILFEKSVSLSVGQIWFVTDIAPKTTAVKTWEAYR
ncbi:hypothetical protein HQ520_01760 [bacterium]|nr:hypothetical protein [bacterium]